jgi:hypothetical protein
MGKTALSDLPYHCPVLKADYLKPPCEGQVAAAKVHRNKFPHAVMPYGLEQCLGCRGKELMTRPEVPQETTQKEEPISYPVRIAPESSTNEAPRCPKHLDEPQIQCGPDSKRAGQYLGVCKICIGERRIGRKKGTNEEKMMPAVARDLGKKGPKMRQLSPEKIAEGREAVKRLSENYVHFKPKKQEEPVPAVKITEREAIETGVILSEALATEENPRYWPPAAALEAVEVRYCKTHPKVPQRKDKLGRWMGMCDECLAARGKKRGEENFANGVSAPPITIPLNLPKYAPLKAWLEDQAEDGERKLWQQIIFVLKQAWRQEA